MDQKHFNLNLNKSFHNQFIIIVKILTDLPLVYLYTFYEPSYLLCYYSCKYLTNSVQNLRNVLTHLFSCGSNVACYQR